MIIRSFQGTAQQKHFSSVYHYVEETQITHIWQTECLFMGIIGKSILMIICTLQYQNVEFPVFCIYQLVVQVCHF